MRIRPAALCIIAFATLSAAACSPTEPPASSPAPEAGEAAPSPAPGPGEPTLEEVRALTEKYTDINVALADGYVRDPADVCDMATHTGKPAEWGGMGVHYAHFGQAGVAGPPPPGGKVDGIGTHTDFRKPTVLIYEPQADGSMVLVAVENLVFKAAWDAANPEPPTFHGVKWDEMADDPATPIDEAHGFAPHYDRHVWIYRDNPRGVFATHNPNVTCEHHKGAMPPMQH
jgi:hypothetical protein